MSHRAGKRSVDKCAETSSPFKRACIGPSAVAVDPPPRIRARSEFAPTDSSFAAGAAAVAAAAAAVAAAAAPSKCSLCDRSGLDCMSGNDLCIANQLDTACHACDTPNCWHSNELCSFFCRERLLHPDSQALGVPAPDIFPREPVNISSFPDRVDVKIGAGDGAVVRWKGQASGAGSNC